MPLTRFERLLPWSGAVAGLCWIGQDALQHMTTKDVPGAATTAVIHDHLGLNYGSVACLVVMGIALLFFATAVRNLLRSGEGREATYSSIAYGGWVVVVAGLTLAVPDAGLLPTALSIEIEVALVVDQVSVDDWPALIEVGEAEKVAVGAGCVTVTVAVFVVVPPGPVAVSV